MYESKRKMYRMINAWIEDSKSTRSETHSIDFLESMCIYVVCAKFPASEDIQDLFLEVGENKSSRETTWSKLKHANFQIYMKTYQIKLVRRSKFARGVPHNVALFS